MNTPYTEEDVSLLFNLIGQGIWYLQHLEHVVTTFTALKILEQKRNKGAKITEKVVEKVLDKQRRFTLGPLISNAKKEQTIPKKLINRFDDFLIERNWLVHKCVVNEYLSLRNEQKKNELFERIALFSKEAISLRNEVYVLMESWYKHSGYDLEYAYQLADHEINNAEKR